MGIAVMMNNYFHDVATALLAVSGVMLLVFGKIAERHEAQTPGALAFFVDSYHRLTRLAKIALVWIVLGGIVRTVTYEQFEWANAVGKSQVPALMVKHVLIFSVLGIGIAGWLRVRGRVRKIEAASRSQASS